MRSMNFLGVGRFASFRYEFPNAPGINFEVVRRNVEPPSHPI